MSGLNIERYNEEKYTNEEDLYPSRVGGRARLIDRIDAVVHTDQNDSPPVEISCIKHFEEQGFVILNDLFSLDEVHELAQESVRLRTDPVIQESNETITEPDSIDVRSLFRLHEVSPVS
jgi:ectoine hydroxylase